MEIKKYFLDKIPVAFIFLVLSGLLSGILFQSCENDDDDVTSSHATPVVRYIRLTESEKSDSLVTHAFMGNTIAIIGENLGAVVEIWFNDQEAILNNSFITNTSIVVTIPNEIPEIVTNEIRLVTKGEVESTHPFGVDVPAPMVASMLCEYVEDGNNALIRGNFFLDDPNKPLQVFFPGNLEAEIKSVTINEIVVTVPEGAGVGPITVKSLYGSSRSSFYFRDDRNFILDWDNLTAAGGWRSGKIGNSNPDPIDGNYVRFQGDMPADASSKWDEDSFSFNLWNQANGRSDEPFYSGDLSKAVLKFECYVVEPWKSAALQMIFTPYSTTGTNSYLADTNVPRALWTPWTETGSYQTEGWTTVSIPLSNFKYTHEGQTSANSLTNDMLGGLTFFVWHGGLTGEDCTIHMCIDNIRVVPQ
ncbi:glycan-binding surface protein [Maribellus maritimus]|uniref:glycan-binding surface protein n=1 Tax=Maribellus maritimus TaxID=2870838 RepID=UPI001EECC83E|nr:glycan-binding surface protein [Maribellus maritimus]MCG6187249.1 hypothetical protein [Maribellus maritimus]